MTEFHSGYVALVGRPNVGKSTIMNHLIGQKISITSRRPQTTRHRILGIKTDEDTQIIFVDTPGLHARQPRAMNRYLNRAATDSLKDVDVVVFVVEGTRWHDDDEWVLEKLRHLSCPVIVAINKIDRIEDKEALLPVMQNIAAQGDFSDIIPVCARRGEHLDELENAIRKHLPVSVPFYPEDQVTDRSERFLAAELVREKLFRKLGEEIPYGLTVEIESFEENPAPGEREGPLGGKVNLAPGEREGPMGGKEENKVLHIHALIWVEKSSQKPIVIGRKGALLKAVGKEAREDMEKAFDQKVFLQLWVKVKEGWADDDRALRSLGYQDS